MLGLTPLSPREGAFLLFRALGSAKSGNYGHVGRPGEIGGSGPGGGAQETPEAGKASTPENDSLVLAATVEKGKRDGFEHLIRVNGELFMSDGDRFGVQLTVGDLEGGPFDLFHNHPGVPTSLSNFDVRILDNIGLRRVVAISHEGDRYEASRGDKWSLRRFGMISEIGGDYLPPVRGGHSNIHDPEWRKTALTRQHADNLAAAELGIIRYRYHIVSDEMKAVDQAAHEMAARIVDVFKQTGRLRA